MNITETVEKLGLQLIVREPTGQDKPFSVYNDRGVPVYETDELSELVVWLDGYHEGRRADAEAPTPSDP